MQITICGSLRFVHEMQSLAEKLRKSKHKLFIPSGAQRVLKGEIQHRELEDAKKKGTFHLITIERDAIREHYKKIKNCDAILVCNWKKDKKENYIGGNTFLEMGFAHVLNKKIFLLNPIPIVSYRDEIEAMQPIILNGDISKIK